MKQSSNSSNLQQVSVDEMAPCTSWRGLAWLRLGAWLCVALNCSSYHYNVMAFSRLTSQVPIVAHQFYFVFMALVQETKREHSTASVSYPDSIPPFCPTASSSSSSNFLVSALCAFLLVPAVFQHRRRHAAVRHVLHPGHVSR